MKLELFVALRYLRARRKQAVISVVTAISIAGVAAGVAALNVALALNNGMQSEFKSRILEATSHISLLRFGGGTITGYQNLAEELSRMDAVTAVVPAIYAQALLRSDLRRQPGIMKGIDLGQSESAAGVAPRIVEGSLDAFTQEQAVPPIALGEDLSHQLGVLLGDTVQAVGLEGELSPLGRAPRIRNFEVVAIFESGLWEYDANWALIPIEAAQDFMGLGSAEVTALELRVSDIDAVTEIAADIRDQLGSGFVTNTWIELNQPFFAALRLERLALFIAISLIVLVASLNTVSVLTLMVMEKSRDISIISAMGGTPQVIMTVFMLQGVIIGVIGTAIGDVIGPLASWYFDRYQVFRLEEQVYSIPYVPFRTESSDVFLISALAVLISFLATLYPARAASLIDPVEGLRYE